LAYIRVRGTDVGDMLIRARVAEMGKWPAGLVPKIDKIEPQSVAGGILTY